MNAVLVMMVFLLPTAVSGHTTTAAAGTTAAGTTAAGATTTAAASTAVHAGKLAKCAAGDVGNNGFGYTVCGSGVSMLCCHPKSQKCVGPYKPKLGKIDQYTCSENHALYGPKKIAKVVIFPMFSCILVAVCIVHMALGLKNVQAEKRKAELIVPALCIGQTVLAIFVCLSEVWKFAVYSSVLAVIVFHTALNHKQLPKFVFATVILLQFFNVIAILGAASGSNNGIFFPIGTTFVSSWSAGMIDEAGIAGGESCTKYFDNYYTLESIQISHNAADPSVKYSGLCSDGWLTIVLMFLTLTMVLQSIMAGLCFQTLAQSLVSSRKVDLN